MLILGLGSNLGDCLGNLRSALNYLKQLPHFSVQQVSPIYISDALVPENAPFNWDRPYLNLALRCETSLAPHELLQHVKNIEKKVGRTPEKVWGPRIIDIDLLAWDDLIIYDEKLHIPHEHLAERPFALWPLADVAPFWIYPQQEKTAAELAARWGSRFTGEAPFHTRQIAQRIDTPQLVGILNVTPDSFSDGGNFLDPSQAINQFKQLVIDGAEIIDIGAEATNPRAIAISAKEEWRRLEPVLSGILLAASELPILPKISIDTRHPWVAEQALLKGVNWINDVSGLDNPEMKALIAANTCDVVVMHHLGIPVNKNQILSLRKNPVEQVFAWAEQRLTELEKAGITRERIIFDVGIGFGKNAEQCLELLKNSAHFHPLGTRLLIGHSRKLFLGQFTDKLFVERDIETAAFSLFLATEPVDYLRVHHVSMHARMFKVIRACGVTH
jgi:2-amino-4-hydroxy-6-hydroxymethyldihydropteridine diphosphokinase/dihydropteroate synthase